MAGPAGALAAEVVDTYTADELAALMREWGYRADIAVEDSGTYVDSETPDGLFYWIYMLECSRAAVPRCHAIAFNIRFTDQVSDSYLAGWNNENWEGTAIMAETEPMLFWSVPFDGGVSEDWMSAIFDRWIGITNRFSKYLADYEGSDAGAEGAGPPRK